MSGKTKLPVAVTSTTWGPKVKGSNIINIFRIKSFRWMDVLLMLWTIPQDSLMLEEDMKTQDDKLTSYSKQYILNQNMLFRYINVVLEDCKIIFHVFKF